MFIAVSFILALLTKGRNMLCIGRHNGEKLNLYVGDIKIVIVAMDTRKANHCRLGIDAPKEVVIVRDEIDNGGDHGAHRNTTRIR
jgi:sRNA-binding carbon storage regulator CsrA